MPAIHSIGHGARALEEFLATLDAAGLRALADIRTAPASRKHPHFGGSALARALEEHGVLYTHLKELGGWRRTRPDSPHVALRSPGFRGYADHLGSEEFARGYARLTDLARTLPTAYMCAETLWWRCHRRILSDRLVADGWEVIHLRRPREDEAHRMTKEARLSSDRLVYDGGAVSLLADQA
jgi:uncharacterized protein (DUF488 family)